MKIIFLLILAILPVLVIPAYGHDDWYDKSWTSRIPITVNTGQVPSTQSNFPILVNSVFPQLIGASQDEIRFALEDKTLLDYEIEFFNSATGQLTAWVRQPSLSDNLKTYLYYDNPSAIDAQNPSAVWDVSYDAVWHMSDTNDSTSNNHDGTNNGATSITGKLGSAFDFDGTNDYIALNMVFQNTNTIPTMTASAWVRVDSNTGNWSILDFDRSEWFTFTISGNSCSSSNRVCFHTTDGSTDDFTGNAIVADGTWHLVHVVYDGTDKIIYVDGTEDARRTNAHSGGNLGAGQLTRYGFIGDGSEATTFDGGRNNIYFDGSADEIRYDRNVKNADWITTEYNNQNNPSLFYTIGATEVFTVPDSPTGLTISPYGTNGLMISWNEPSDNGSTIIHYNLDKKTNDGAFREFQTITYPTQTFVDTQTDTDETYTYRVSATNGLGTGSESGEVSIFNRDRYSTSIDLTLVKQIEQLENENKMLKLEAEQRNSFEDNYFKYIVTKLRESLSIKIFEPIPDLEFNLKSGLLHGELPSKSEFLQIETDRILNMIKELRK